MRTWTRAGHDGKAGWCGLCDRQIPIGEPIQELRLAGTLTKDGEVTAEIHVKAPKVRCAMCADEPVPADLPPLAERSTAIAPTVSRPHTRDLDFTSGGRA